MNQYIKGLERLLIAVSFSSCNSAGCFSFPCLSCAPFLFYFTLNVLPAITEPAEKIPSVFFLFYFVQYYGTESTSLECLGEYANVSCWKQRFFLQDD